MNMHILVFNLGSDESITLRVQVPNYKVSTQHHNYDSEYGDLEYPILRYFGPLGLQTRRRAGSLRVDGRATAVPGLLFSRLRLAAPAIGRKIECLMDRKIGRLFDM